MTRAVLGKSAIVTGAGSGINLEFARLLLKNGANVLFADLALRPEAQLLVDEYQGQSTQAKAVFQKTNVTSWSDLSNMFKVAEKHFGSIDIVCPGAGVFEPPFSSFWWPPGVAPSKDDPLGDRYGSLDINLTHPIRTTQLAISYFLSSSPHPSTDNPKTIVHTASVASEGASIGFPLYHACKWGLRGFIYSLADMETDYNIRVAGVAPGVVRTPLWLDHQDKKKLIETNGEEQDDWITPEQIAEIMLAIVTQNEISTASGEKIPLKGGSLIEVTGSDLKDVPMFGNKAPGAKGEAGLKVENRLEAYKDLHANLRKPGWGKF